MKKRNKMIVGGVAGLGLVISSYGVASASTPATVPQGSIIGSIVSNGTSGSSLIALATVTAAQAQAAAVAAVPGSAGATQVIHDQGYVVYRVLVTSADGTITEVIVDGGDGTVLDHYAPNWDGSMPSTAGVAAAAVGSVAAATVPTGWFTGSIPSNGATGSDLVALATQTAAQADTAAVTAVPGTAGATEIIHDHGFVVYRVLVTATDGTVTEVIVDAGNGTVLDHYTPLWDGTTSTIAAAAVAGTVAAATVPTGWFTGSIPSNGATGSDLVALATQTAAQADTAAVAAVPGTAGATEIIHDHGYVVYRVLVTGTDGTVTEVIVDAGNGTVLDHYTPLWDGSM